MCLATMLKALETNLEPNVQVNLGTGLLVLILAFVGACFHQACNKNTATEPLLLTVEPKSSKSLKTEVATEKHFNGSPKIPGCLAVSRTSNHSILGLHIR
ncbi:6f0e7e19-75c2-46f1-90e3-3866da1e9d92 [Sclerotinia trifoliorum]|uniref:6f0e7e19-75c2-46f1-90e3-3866da1e9d92 n=1 Tax=Sclerotinia trifoliorum TaxID=28548 RepID=A0A8H2W5D2_9HELO|nr:6f0e7e19-75c2-46f1-90e3-3866da1e9d92 [Sclerotinia trifoliorum]